MAIGGAIFLVHSWALSNGGAESEDAFVQPCRARLGEDRRNTRCPTQENNSKDNFNEVQKSLLTLMLAGGRFEDHRPYNRLDILP